MKQSFIQRVENALNELRQNKMVILVDHPDRENEGDLIFPAELTTAEKVNFMIRHCSGIICLSTTSNQLKKIGVPSMVAYGQNTSQRETPFTVSIESKTNVTTGVSAQDRATTILTAIREDVTEHDIAKPGHVFPLHAKDGGVLERQGHTEGAVDLVSIAGFKKAAVLCEIMNPDGTMTRGNQLDQFAEEHDLKILSIDDIIQYRQLKDNLITEEVTAKLPLNQYNNFQISVIKEKFTQKEHVILTKQSENTENSPLVRIHSSCMTGDLFGSQRCDCHNQLHYTLQRMSKEGGILIYLNQEGRGIGLFNKIKSYALQEQGLDTVEANEKLGLPVDSREYYLAANILRNRNIKSVQLLTNNPLKAEGLEKYGIIIEKIVSMPVFCCADNEDYLRTKKLKMNHQISFESIVQENNYAIL